ncbi:MAG TPA: hypothetical protein VHZ29_14200 [Rhizomicrobium sp.]|jgi:hypothetical protein|nr:hypothetical protein [Rhizomicrobium sp.]
MLKKLTIAACLLAPVAAQAFTQCTTKALTGPGAEIAEEGSNPVSSGSWVYAGFLDNGKVGVAASSDAGVTLAQSVILTSGSDTVRGLRIAAIGANVYATWHQKGTGGVHLMFDASHANGAAGSWDPPVDLGKVASNLSQITASGTFVHVAYLTRDGIVAVASSRNEGRKFLAPVMLGVGWGEIVLTSWGSNVYTSWQIEPSQKRWEVMMAVSGDSGKTFAVQNLSHLRPNAATEPIFGMDAASGRVSLVWRENGVPATGYYLRSVDNGQTWSAPLAIDAPARQFMVADDGGTLYISYLKEMIIDDVPDWQVQVATSADGGLSFPKIQNLTGMTGITNIIQDDFRPIPWVRGEHAYRLTGIKADGVYMWNGNNGRISTPAFLGPGYLAAPALNSAVWQSSNGMVTYGLCR